MNHQLTERRSPTHILIMCSCGWHREISRRQNALARAAGVRSAARGHYAEKTDEMQRSAVMIDKRMGERKR